MTAPSRDYAWLPDHQLHVASTLAHADDIIGRVGTLILEYSRLGALELETVAEGQRATVRVKSVAPLPAAIARCTADAMTQLRGALEHTLYAEIEHRLGRELDEVEGRAVEMPAALTWVAFGNWLNHRARVKIEPLRDGTQLVERIRDLQPYQRTRSADQHPLRVLVEHTNYAKHRAPAVAQTQLGAVIPDSPTADLLLAQPHDDRAIEAGDVLASGPLYTRVPLSIWPKVSIRRQSSRTWHMLMGELEQLADWVNRIAIPRLIVGTHQVDPLPLQLNIAVGHNDLRVALAQAGTATASARFRRQLDVGVVREGLAEALALHTSSPDLSVLQRWVDSLSDDEVLEKHGKLSEYRARSDLLAFNAVVLGLLAEVSSAGEV